jgi:aspartyl-tRNA(Asn)/glutamyl-tRNA(Gln) amidotransferase subunit A
VGDPTELTLAAAAAAVVAGELSPMELTTAYLQRIDGLNPLLTAYVEVTADRALADAATLTDEAAAGRLRGPLHGVPIALKDLIDTAGIPTRAGTLGYQERVPDTDATIAHRLREAGTVLLGKTATHELAYGVTTSNPKAYGSTRNPWDVERIPGGSSGGSAAAVAAGLAAAATGTDTGGSIRIPAALCGCVGFKPTYGLVSRAGIAPLSWLLDHAGPITQTVTDAALVLDAISGYDAADEATLPDTGGVSGLAGRLRRDPRGWRVGVPRSTAWSALEPGVAAATEAALAQLEALGMHLIEVDLPSLEGITGPIFAFVSAECRTAHATIWPDRRDEFGPDLQQLLALPALDGDATVAVLRAMAGYAQALRRVLTEVDLLASPTVPVVAPRLGAQSVRLGSADVPLISALIANTFPYNLARLPAVSVPCGDADGLPVGLQLAGAPMADARVLQAAYAYEQTSAWQQRRPSLTPRADRAQ